LHLYYETATIISGGGESLSLARLTSSFHLIHNHELFFINYQNTKGVIGERIIFSFLATFI
jgi:hypothetical protein